MPPVDASRSSGTVAGVETLPRVLVLNATAEPLHLVGLSRAVALVLLNRAEVVSFEGYLRSECLLVPRPTVIRLSRYVHVPWRNAQLTLRTLCIRDRGLCQWCLTAPGETIDHVVPRSRGGAHSWSNVVLACQRCNNRKGDKLADELGWSLPRTPYEPTRHDIVRFDPRVLEHVPAHAS